MLTRRTVNRAKFFANGTTLAHRPFLCAKESQQTDNSEYKNKQRPADGCFGWKIITFKQSKADECANKIHRETAEIPHAVYFVVDSEM